MTRLSLASIAGAASLILSSFTAPPAHADNYPSKTIVVIADGAAGGVVDIWARRIALRMGDVLKQPVIVENRPGASGTIAAEAAARAQPDGYTVLFGGMSPLVTFPGAGGVVRYDPARSFIPAAGGTQGYPQLLANSALNIRSLAELVEFARKRPEGVTCATGGHASLPHFACEMTARALGIRLRVIPYKSGPPAFQDVMGGQVHLAIGYASETEAFVAAGRLTSLAIFGPGRMAKTPSVPTFEEEGHTNMSLPSFNGFYFPAKTPPEIVEKFNAASISVWQQGELLEAIRALGGFYVSYKPGEFAEFVRAQQTKWKRMSDDFGIKTEQ